MEEKQEMLDARCLFVCLSLARFIAEISQAPRAH